MTDRSETSGGRRIGLWLGLAVFLLLLAVPVAPDNPAASRLAALAFLMAVWWVSDAIPLFATALLGCGKKGPPLPPDPRGPRLPESAHLYSHCSTRARRSATLMKWRQPVTR